MLEDDSRTPNRLKPTQNENICKMLKVYQFGDTILRGGVTSFRTQPTCLIPNVIRRQDTKRPN